MAEILNRDLEKIVLVSLDMTTWKQSRMEF